ncbi:ATP-binding cassette domain-containing protein [Buchnera aphidicola (Muscaphis stroyani)]|uniref:ATP-binding protein Uup n=1 Tax=Buchnera aphidicola (Muscaphis stroyani) TaxID=1241869 RepID=A0A4D6Y441_9GAMM|nr:ATP-binding cassette domain-containing protein [Buchnera aphidicola]QCI24426.1 ATP-binding cassette domain-containing protein [Buchnera aphidicola (Muscaphis stroyani)]
MFLVNVQNACLSFGNLEILKNAMLCIHNNERICLIGKNGTGKSTLLKVIKKKQDLDLGQVIYKKNITIGCLNQFNPTNLNISVYNFIKKGIENKKSYKKIENQYEKHIYENTKIETIINKIKLNKYDLLSQLSGGLLRIACLGYVLVGEPDLLLLDEPTNHLDIKSVKWLEKFLIKFHGSILFVSHDRSFIQNISTRIIDLDRGKLISWEGDYFNFVKLKKESYRIEETHKKLFDYNLEKEEKWIRKGIKARTTRNEGRIKNLIELRKKKLNYKKIEKLSNIKINQIKTHSNKIIFNIKNISYNMHNTVVVKNFSEIIKNGDKIGLIGNNGCGKTTILKMILGQIQPEIGKIYTGSELKISYFDQNRSVLDPNKSIIDNINFGKEKCIIEGKEQHLFGYLKNFLFNPNKLRSLVKTLSGGERNRLLLARLFLQPSNVLILDEPTNDLDLDTLQLLEKIITNYSGTILIVSHDREFIKNTVNKYWIFKKNGFIDVHIGNYNFEEYQNKKFKSKIKKIENNVKIKKQNKSHFQKELHKTINKIKKIENKIKQLQFESNASDFFEKELKERLIVLKLLNESEKELDNQLNYWEHLESLI